MEPVEDRAGSGASRASVQVTSVRSLLPSDCASAESVCASVSVYVDLMDSGSGSRPIASRSLVPIPFHPASDAPTRIAARGGTLRTCSHQNTPPLASPPEDAHLTENRSPVMPSSAFDKAMENSSANQLMCSGVSD